MRIAGIENKEVPLVQFDIVIDGGLLMENIDKVGVSNLLARMMTEGTKNKTPQQLEEAIQQLGASINVFAGMEDIRMSVNTLAKNFQQTVNLVEEILLEPRFDANEFALIKQSVLSTLKQQEGEPNALAQRQFNEQVYGRANIRSRSILGNAASVGSITLDDLKSYYANNISPNVARILVVGAFDKTTITTAFNHLAATWKGKKVEIPGMACSQRKHCGKSVFL